MHEDPAVVGPATKTKPLCLNCLQPATGEDRYIYLTKYERLQFQNIKSRILSLSNAIFLGVLGVIFRVVENAVVCCQRGHFTVRRSVEFWGIWVTEPPSPISRRTLHWCMHASGSTGLSGGRRTTQSISTISVDTLWLVGIILYYFLQINDQTYRLYSLKKES